MVSFLFFLVRYCPVFTLRISNLPFKYCYSREIGARYDNNDGDHTSP